MTEKAPEVIKNLFEAQQAAVLSQEPMTRQERLDLQKSVIEISKKYGLEVDQKIKEAAKKRYFSVSYHSQIYNGDTWGTNTYTDRNGGYASKEDIINRLKNEQKRSYPEITDMTELSKSDSDELTPRNQPEV